MLRGWRKPGGDMNLKDDVGVFGSVILWLAVILCLGWLVSMFVELVRVIFS